MNMELFNTINLENYTKCYLKSQYIGEKIIQKNIKFAHEGREVVLHMLCKKGFECAQYLL